MSATSVIYLYCDFSYLSILWLQLSAYAVISVIYLCCDFSYLSIHWYSDFSYLSIQWLQLSTYTVTSVIYLCCDFSYTVYTILVSIYSRDHKISMSSWKASIAETTRFLCLPEKQASVCNFSYLSVAETTRFLCPPEKQTDRCLWLQLFTYVVTSVIYLSVISSVIYL